MDGVAAGEVLLAPRVSEPDAATTRGRLAARMRLVDVGDRVVWHLGDATAEWTLPDQPRRAQTPVLASIEYAETWRRGQRGVMLAEGYLLLVSDDGTPLARLARVSSFDPDLYTDRDLARIWPARVFENLVSRGVVRRTTTYDDLAALEAARPGAAPPTRGVLLSGRTIALLWLAGLALLVVLLVVNRRH
jgi:hypothetical protein